jgi:hypothetical protein
MVVLASIYENNYFVNNLLKILKIKINNFEILRWGLGIGDWGLGIGDWGLGPIPNPQSPSPIPNPQSPSNYLIYQ